MDSRELPLATHLQELRVCLRNGAAAFILASFVSFWFAEQLFVILARPLIVAWRQADLGTAEVGFASLTEPLWVYLDLALYAGLFLASPVIFHQLWRFVAPGLYRQEKRIAVPFAGLSALFFVGGAVFCYYLVLPPACQFLLSYASNNVDRISDALGFVASAGPLAVKPNLFMRQYLDLVLKMLVAFGLVFELPLLIFFLSYAGLVTHRGLWRFNKYAIILAFVIGAVLTPGPDVVSQVLMAGPMIVLYNLSILVAFQVTRIRERRSPGH
ncbi:MAG: twin-arginine translocase subunit TatC [Pseudomonadota bacterium]